MKTLIDLYKENPKEYAKMAILANEQNKKLDVVDDKLVLIDVEQPSDYQTMRRFNYPEIGEQLDLLWHAIDEGKLDKTSDFYLRLKAVKDEFPKD